MGNRGILSWERNYPNPFNSGTIIPFSLSRETEVHLQVFDVLGRPVANLVVGRLQTGRHRVNWEGLDSGGQRVSSGIYFYRLRGRNRAESPQDDARAVKSERVRQTPDSRYSARFFPAAVRPLVLGRGCVWHRRSRL